MTRCQRRRINRQNAQKSTGPKSPEGKESSRRNAVKHGLRADALTLPNEDPAEVAARTDAWFEHYEPEVPAERALVEQAALASLRLHRCAKFEQATLAQQVRDAERDWDRRQEEKLADLQALLPTEPAAAVRALKGFGAGRKWLLEQWETLWTRLGPDHHWKSAASCDRAIQLLGVDLQNIRESPDGFTLILFSIAAQPAPTDAQLAWLRDPKHAPPSMLAQVTEGLPDRETSRQELMGLVMDEVMKAIERAEKADPAEKADRAECRDRALLIQDAPTARLLLRYQSTAQSAFHRAYAALTKLDDAEVEEEEIVPAKVVAPNEAKPAEKPKLNAVRVKVCDEAKVAVRGVENRGVRPRITQTNTEEKEEELSTDDTD